MSFEKEFPAVPKALVDILKRIPKAALGFSGGVDSSYLLYAAKTCGVEIRGYYAKSQFQPQFELDDARKIAKQVGADIKVLAIDALSNDRVKENPADRCYHCKRVIFSRILEEAKADGYALLMDGSNASDDAGDRPGMRALTELKVISPLREAGLTKDEIREYSREAGLFTWKSRPMLVWPPDTTGRALDNEILYKVSRRKTNYLRWDLPIFVQGIG